MTTADIVPGRRYRRRADGQLVQVERIFGRGRNRQVKFTPEDDPLATHWLPVKSFAERFERVEESVR